MRVYAVLQLEEQIMQYYTWKKNKTTALLMSVLVTGIMYSCFL